VKVGTSSGRPQSALLIPVPAAEAVVAEARLAHDPVAAAGVPAHITLIVPWLEPSELDADDLALPELNEALADCKAFDFELSAVRWFGDRVLWLAPEPTEPFRDLTERLATRFCTPPWAGKFSDLVPHLTIGHAGVGGPLAPVADRLAAQLPLACRAEEVRAMVGDGARWQVYARIPLS
jgi:2'-5' RNA ligase